MVYLFWTCETEEKAQAITHLLLEKRLIACASIFPRVLSIYRWEGKITEASEVKVLLKTQKNHFRLIEELIVEQGGYEVPELAALEVSQAHLPYLHWLEQETTPSG